MAYVPSSPIARGIGCIMARYAEPMVLKRAGSADLALQGKLSMKTRSAGAGEVANSFDGASLYVQIGNTELAAAGWGIPKRTDAITDSAGKTYRILHVDTRRLGSETVSHFLWVDG